MTEFSGFRDRANLVAISALGAEIVALPDDELSVPALVARRTEQLLDATVTIWWTLRSASRSIKPISGGMVTDRSTEPSEPLLAVLRGGVAHLEHSSTGARRLFAPVLVTSRTMGVIQVDCSVGRDDLDAADLAATIAVAERLGNEMTTRQLRADLRRRADHDTLTGLPNRFQLLRHLNHACATRTDTGTTPFVIFLDIDGFKTINDSLGHTIGDRVLVEVTQRLRGQLRDVDFVARFGGDEFVVVLHEALSPAELLTVLDRLTSTPHEPVRVGPHRLFVTLSAGVAACRADDDADSLLRHADAAMYDAKQSRIHRWCWYVEHLSTVATDRLHTETDLYDGLERGELFVELQPVVDLATGATVAHESLVRWSHPRLGRLMPDAFVPVAEACGLIVPLTDYVLHRSLEVASEWPAGSLVSVNISARHLADRGMVRMVQRALDDTGSDPSRLMVEITETAVMGDREHAIDHLDQLHALGVRVAVDDFGTGYTSINDLKRIPVDLLKIDRSFTAASATPSGWAMLHALSALASAVGVLTVAEGVETVEQLDAVRRSGCQWAQGYLLGRPAPVEHVSHDVVPVAVPA